MKNKLDKQKSLCYNYNKEDKSKQNCLHTFNILVKGEDIMTLEEVAARVGISPSTLYHNFKRTQKSLEKKGLILTKDEDGNYDLKLKED